MNRDPVERPWSVPVAVADIPETGHRVELKADAATRAAVAKLAGLDGLPRLEASFDLVRHGRDGVCVVGAVSATVDQTCVVTLEPVRSEVSENVDLVFMPSAPTAEGEDEGLPALDAGEVPEPLIDGMVDLGVVAVEFLILGINPYPRKPDVVFEPPAQSETGGHPFAALAALKRDGSDKKR